MATLRVLPHDRRSPALPIDQIRSACLSLHWPSRSALLARDPWTANSATRSPRRLHDRQQCPHVFRVKPPPYNRASAILESGLQSSASRPVGWSKESPPLELPRISLLSSFPAAASSTSRNATRATSARGRTPPHSPHSASVRKSACATSSLHLCFDFRCVIAQLCYRRPSSARMRFT